MTSMGDVRLRDEGGSSRPHPRIVAMRKIGTGEGRVKSLRR